jgi:hypothetical protein
MSNSNLRHLLPGVAVALLVLPLAGCGLDSLKPTPSRALDLTMYDFSSDIRWGDFDAAYDFVDPKTKLEHPLTGVESARFKQIEVSAYTVISHVETPTTVDQQVQLQLINRNTQIPRSMVYHEHWRWDVTLKKWWLTTGLPDISPQE